MEEIEKVAREEKRTKSKLVREALRRYLAELQWERLSRYAQIKAAATGIATEEDIQRLINEARAPVKEKMLFLQPRSTRLKTACLVAPSSLRRRFTTSGWRRRRGVSG